MESQDRATNESQCLACKVGRQGTQIHVSRFPVGTQRDIACWSGGDTELLQTTAASVVTCAKLILDGLTMGDAAT